MFSPCVVGGALSVDDVGSAPASSFEALDVKSEAITSVECIDAASAVVQLI